MCSKRGLKGQKEGATWRFLGLPDALTRPLDIASPLLALEALSEDPPRRPLPGEVVLRLCGVPIKIYKQYFILAKNSQVHNIVRLVVTPCNDIL